MVYFKFLQLETDADNINDMGTITLESEPINVGDYLLLEYRAKKKSLQYVGEVYIYTAYSYYG